MAADRLVATGSPGWHSAPHSPPGRTARGLSSASFLAWADVPGAREAPLSAHIRRSSCHDHWRFAGRAENVYAGRSPAVTHHAGNGRWPARGEPRSLRQPPGQLVLRARGAGLVFGQADRAALAVGNGRITEC